MLRLYRLKLTTAQRHLPRICRLRQLLCTPQPAATL
jgi:hypothetical protein